MLTDFSVMSTISLCILYMIHMCIYTYTYICTHTVYFIFIYLLENIPRFAPPHWSSFLILGDWRCVGSAMGVSSLISVIVVSVLPSRSLRLSSYDVASGIPLFLLDLSSLPSIFSLTVLIALSFFSEFSVNSLTLSSIHLFSFPQYPICKAHLPLRFSLW